MVLFLTNNPIPPPVGRDRNQEENNDASCNLRA